MVKLILLGPTAVGKTALSLELARHFSVSVISADSRQCYKYMNIGTAKPTFGELCSVRHYNISCLDLHETDTASDFLKRTKKWISAMTDRICIFCGGSTLHLRVLIRPFDDIPSAREEHVHKLEKEIKRYGLTALFKKLQKVDPVYAEKMDGLNRQRIIRALDVWMQTGKPFSSFHTKSGEKISPDENTLVVGLFRGRKNLYRRINSRTEAMLKKGLIKEVRHIKGLGYTPDYQALNTVGYREVFQFLDGDLTKSDMLQQIQVKTRRYAKRQITWFRRWPFIHWINIEEKSRTEAADEIIKLVEAHGNNC